jgi:hypothetical protein
LETRSNTLLFGTAIGLDLWIFEISMGPFLMYHNTKVNLRTCRGNTNIKGDLDTRYKPSTCQLYPDEVINLDEQQFFGFAVGWRDEGAIVFLQTDNWRISTGGSNTHILKIYDSDFKPVQYRGLNYNPNYNTDPQLACQPHQIATYDESTYQTTYRDGDCRNSKGEDMPSGADWTAFLQITYYFL